MQNSTQNSTANFSSLKNDIKRTVSLTLNVVTRILYEYDEYILVEVWKRVLEFGQVL